MVTKNFVNVDRNVRAMAALTGSVLLSADALVGRGGVKLCFQRGYDIEAAVFVTDQFKQEKPGMTMLLREACVQGWKAVKAEDLKGRGRRPSLLLRGEGEAIAGFEKTRVKCFSADEFLRWLTTSCLQKDSSGRVKAA